MNTATGNAVICKENYSDELLAQLKKWAKVTKTDGALAIVQLSHAGRQTPLNMNPTPFAPSAVQLTITMNGESFGVPVALSEKQIQSEVIDRFVFAAKTVFEAGFDGVQLHGAHGFLLSEFLSPTTNIRTDKYGGTPENRARIILDIYRAIRSELGETGKDFLIGIKSNSVEFQKDGLQPEEARLICELYAEVGFDFVELSGGSYENMALSNLRETTKAREAFFLEFTDKIRPAFENSSSKMFVTGGFRTTAGMVRAIQDNSTDGIGLARPTTQEPDLPKKLLSGECWSAPDSKLDQQNFSLNALAAHTQMLQMGEKDLVEVGGRVCSGIADFSHQQEANNFQKQLMVFMKQMAAKKLAGEKMEAFMKYENIRFFIKLTVEASSGSKKVAGSIKRHNEWWPTRKQSRVNIQFEYVKFNSYRREIFRRTDKYGGSPDNRARIILDIYRAIRSELGEAGKHFLIGIKSNSVEFQKDGLQPEDDRLICQLYADVGFDFVELSGGNYENIALGALRPTTKEREAFFLEFTDKIRPVFESSNTKMFVTGGFRTTAGMVRAILDNSTDGIGFGRPTTHEPDLPKKLLSGQYWSAPDSKLDQQNFGLTLCGCHSQMHQIGEKNLKEVKGRPCKEIADFSNQQEANNYMQHLGAFMQLMSEKKLAGERIDIVMKYENIVEA